MHVQEAYGSRRPSSFLPSSTNIKQTQHDAKRISGGKESKAAGQIAAPKTKQTTLVL